MILFRRDRMVVLVLWMVFSSAVFAQAFQGNTLFCPNNSKYAYMVNMNNTVIHTWTSNRNGGYSAYLLPNGDLLRTAVSSGTSLNGGGAQGVVERRAWDNTLMWEYTYASTTYRAHHDIEPMPNGNILMIAWELKTAAEAVQAGLNHSAPIWPDHIIEVQPNGTNGGTIVWQWHAWDHLIQDFDPTKDNYGVVADHPELFDINVESAGSGDWLHINGISYNPERDEIVISSHELDEIYIIDHSTTTLEAAGHTGGNSGHGGDILYRWGRPANYDAPGSQVFNVVHCAVWVADSLPGAGHVMAFNNREGQGTSMVVELELPIDNEGHYIWTPGTAYLPTSPIWSYTASGFYSNHLGGVQRLPNGNTLIVESTSGYLFEVNQAGVTQWSYNRGGEVVRALRYPADYVTDIDEAKHLPTQPDLFQNYPNPFNPATTIRFEQSEPGMVTLRVFNILGQEVRTLVSGFEEAGSKSVTWDGRNNGGETVSTGIYFYRLETRDFSKTRKMIFAK